MEKREELLYVGIGKNKLIVAEIKDNRMYIPITALCNILDIK